MYVALKLKNGQQSNIVEATGEDVKVARKEERRRRILLAKATISGYCPFLTTTGYSKSNSIQAGNRRYMTLVY